MINFIVEVDDKAETKELIDFLKKHHDVLIYCRDCDYYDTEDHKCSLIHGWKAPDDHCKYAKYATKI